MINRDHLEKLRRRARQHLDEWEGRWTDVVGPSTPENPALRPVYGRSMDLLYKYIACEAEYFLHGKDTTTIQDQMASIAKLAAEYLTGDWRRQAIEDDRESLDWMDQVRFGLHAALVADDHDSVAAIKAFLDSDPDFESGTWGRTKQDAICYQKACELFLNQNSFEPFTVKGTRTKQFAKVLEAIASQDGRMLNNSFTKYMSTYISKEHSDDGNIVFSVDGSILAELIKRRQEACLPEDCSEWLVTTACFE